MNFFEGVDFSVIVVYNRLVKKQPKKEKTMKRYEEVSVTLERFSEEDIIATSNTGNAGTDTPLQPVEPDDSY